MQCGATTAVSKSLALLSAARPVPALTSDDAELSPKPDPVVLANDTVLAALKRDWLDFRALTLPKGQQRQDAVSDYVRLLQREFASAPLLMVNDPRVSLLMPLWLDAARQAEARPSFVLMLPDPAASASSIMARAGLSADAAVALWLRYTLDAERNSRGNSRTILVAERFLKDPISTLDRAGAALGLSRTMLPDTTTRDMQDIADTRSLSSSVHLDAPLLDLAKEVHAVLAQGDDLPDVPAKLDDLRVDFDAAVPAMHPRAASGKYGGVVHKAQQSGASRATQDATTDSVAKLHPYAKTDADEIDSIKTDLDEATTMVAALLAQNRELTDQFERVAADLGSAKGDLARARRRPLKTLRDFLRFKALRGLSKASPPIPARMAQRFGRSAAKRDPNRSLLQPLENLAPGVAPVVIPTSASEYATHHAGRVARNPDWSDILVVSHDASRTGAPILALNLVRVLSHRHNVTTLCLRGGELLKEFREHSVAVWEAGKPTDEGPFFVHVLDDVIAEQPFAFAAVNSVEARHMLLPLRARGVPSVALLHEFASYTLPRSAYPNAISWADQTVFSTSLTLDNAVDTHHLTRTPTMHILPQGKCEVPTAARSPAERKLERTRLSELFRPNGESSRRFIVIGAGYVQIRKGVDLFIDTAMRVLNDPAGKNAIFVWIGAGYDPEKDFAYSVYLQDQLRRAGLTERVLIIPETPEIEAVYSLADALVLTSRLDPLPNVAIDAMCAGLPVLCFDRTTGIAESLTDAGLQDACVSGYLDTTDLADKLITLASSPQALDEVAEKVRTYAKVAFDFEAYAARIEKLAVSANDFPAILNEDAETIRASGRFRPDFCLEAQSRQGQLLDGIGTYIKRIRCGVYPRRPEPGFHPYIYAENLAGTLRPGADPYAEYLRRGRPEGPWMLPVIEGGGAASADMKPIPVRAALHIHAYYTDQLADVVQRLEKNATRPDLFVSVADDAGERAARKHFSRYSGTVASIMVVPNAGRDIGPFLTGFGPDLTRDYDFVGHVHTKKSTHLKNADVTADWVTFAYSGVLGGKRAGPMMDRILEAMAQDDRIGIAYPDDPNIMGWTENLQPAESLAQSMAVGELPKVFNFPIGTMFWMRSAALQPFVDLDLTWADYPAEPAPNDGTMLHALERLFGIVPQLQGWQTVVTNIPNTTR